MKKDITLTSTDLMIWSALLTLYNDTKKPVTVPELSDYLGLIYTTIKYSINKLKKLGVIESTTVTNKEGQQVTGYIPKSNIVVIFPNSLVMVVLDYLVIPLHFKNIYVSEEKDEIKIIPLSEANEIIKAAVEDLIMNPILIEDYKRELKKEYLKLLLKQYESIREYLYS